MAIYVPDTAIVSISDSSVPADMREHAKSVCAIVNEQQIGKGVPKREMLGFRFTTGAYGVKYHGEQLCGALHKGMPTVWGPESGYPAGTGFVIGKKLIATAYHVVEDVMTPKRPESLRAVFGLELNANLSITRKQVQVFDVAGVYEYDEQRDWAVLELGKSLGAAHPALPQADERELVRLAPNSNLAMIGHPFGQPMQYSTGQFLGPGSFGDLQAKLAGFTGNSGSPVFALGSLGKVIGIYKSHQHDEDFEKTLEQGHRCWRYKRVPMGVSEHDTLASITAVAT